MRAISLWQPWATFMALGLKKIETRSWNTNVRGRILIHAGKHVEWPTDKMWRLLQDNGIDSISLLPTGALLCSVELVESVPAASLHASILEKSLGDFRAGRWAWKTENLWVLQELIPWTGHQGFFNVPINGMAFNVNREDLL